MATTSFRLRRLRDRQPEVQQQLITFRLNETDFLLPIESAHRALDLDSPLQDTQLEFDGQNITVVDGKQKIFGEAASTDPIHIVMIVQDAQGDRIALPINTAPALCRIKPSSFVPLPKTHPIQCVSAMTDATAELPFYFLLDPAKLTT